MLIVWRAQFDDVGAHHVHAAKAPQDQEDFTGGEAEGFGQLGSGQICRIDAVGVQCEIERAVSDDALDLLQNAGHARLEHFRHGHDPHAGLFGKIPVCAEGAADADLDGAFGIDGFVENRVQEHRTIVLEVALEAAPRRVGMGVDVDQPDRFARSQTLEDRMRHGVYAAG